MTRTKAPRHQGIEARSDRTAFTLIEILMAIIILGIGVISIASLFPAGIAQQRLSIDDGVGPQVANNAIQIIRSKVKAEDFGTFEEFGVLPDFWPTTAVADTTGVRGDWPWLRPAIMIADDVGTTGLSGKLDETGANDVFCYYRSLQAEVHSHVEFETSYPGTGSAGIPKLFGIPFNSTKYPHGNAPRVMITQQERFYPMMSRAYVPYESSERPQYAWDCMFRRFQGKILVAIFVYRVNMSGGGTSGAFVAAGDPWVPQRLELGSHGFAMWNAEIGAPAPGGGPGGPPTGSGLGEQFGPGGPGGPPSHGGGGSNNTGSLLNPILGAQANVLFNPNDPIQAWQEPRQWILDQNNNIHRVSGVSRVQFGQPLRIELVRPVAPVPALAPYFLKGTPPETNAVVRSIWYMPLSANSGQFTITPVYVTVKEL